MDDCAHCRHVHEENLRVLKHEAERAFLDHDADGRCCLIARMTPTEEKP